MATEKRLIDAIKHRLECHIAKAIHWGVDNIPMGKDSSSAFEFLRGYERGATETANIVLSMIPVDAVEVVRCKDCKHSKLPAVLTQKYGEPGTLTCHNWHSPCNKRNVNQNDFCSYGERKPE